ncbi:hypothetical protein AB0301_14670 [Microbacterium profundi]|uniref:Uncharacterized protein n=1 Tax=Microbacterium profundi TaxID=450380 RepID=A0ABV3LKI8_9MICO
MLLQKDASVAQPVAICAFEEFRQFAATCPLSTHAQQLDPLLLTETYICPLEG